MAVTRYPSEALRRFIADVTRRDEVRCAVSETLARFGRIDVWVNNAGRGITKMPTELSDDDVDDMMRVNVPSLLTEN